MPQLNPALTDKLTRLALALIDQQQARVVVPPMQAESGFWFGGGNVVEANDGTLYLVGRYRNAGDSRTGLAAGERGFELAVFASIDRGESFQKVLQLDKAALSRDDRTVLSIEGAAIVSSDDGYELFVSTEKDGVGYPPGFDDHLKPGTGVWSIDCRRASSI
ncbi:MAG: exo-alpha-sialidase, partial [Planctomycetaceae bacterium]|nr:exo-alpha-sialidase [Planctomycetaceae bacterium]